MPLELLDSVML